jgi:peptide/nickel transport system permease protein
LLAYILRRLIALIPILFGMTIITFVLSHVIPGDPARYAAGLIAGPEQVEQVRKEMGLDRPLFQQYLLYMNNLVHGDLGQSFRTHRLVRDDIRRYFPATIELSFTAILMSTLVGIAMGTLSAYKKNTWIDQISRSFSIFGVSMPVFWLSLLLQIVFYAYLGWFPSGDRITIALGSPKHITGLFLVDSLMTGDFKRFFSSLYHIVLPAVSLALTMLAITSRMTRSSLLDVLGSDYVRTARAKGLNEFRVVCKHALKNSMIPTTTVIGAQFGWLLGGTFIVETIFSWPGIGTYGVQAIIELDFPVIMGLTILLSFLYVMINLWVDIVYAFLDPRIEYS